MHVLWFTLLVPVGGAELFFISLFYMPCVRQPVLAAAFWPALGKSPTRRLWSVVHVQIILLNLPNSPL